MYLHSHIFLFSAIITSTLNVHWKSSPVELVVLNIKDRGRKPSWKKKRHFEHQLGHGDGKFPFVNFGWIFFRTGSFWNGRNLRQFFQTSFHEPKLIAHGISLDGKTLVDQQRANPAPKLTSCLLCMIGWQQHFSKTIPHPTYPNTPRLLAWNQRLWLGDFGLLCWIASRELGDNLCNSLLSGGVEVSVLTCRRFWTMGQSIRLRREHGSTFQLTVPAECKAYSMKPDGSWHEQLTSDGLE